MANRSVNPKAQIPRHFDIGKMLIYITLLAGVVISIAPFFWMVSASLMNLTEATGREWLPSSPQWDNYLEAWFGSWPKSVKYTATPDTNFSDYFTNSMIIASITVVGQLVFCTLAAYAFASIKFPGKNALFSILLITLMIPEAVVWIPNFITVTWIGRVGPIPWINNWPALTIPFMASAFSIFLLRQFFQQLPSELWDSAQIDGAGHLRYLLQVVIPLSKPPLLTVLLFTFIGSWNSLAWPILVTTDYDWRPISYGLLSFLDEAGAQVHLQMAGSVITILPIIIMYLLIQRSFTEGIATTGLKG